METGLQPAAWHEFFGVVATASAALAGLFFVAISLHPDQVGSHPVLRYRARANLQMLLLILGISVAVLIPGQTAVVVGVEVIVIAVLFTALGTAGAVQMSRRAQVATGVWMRLGVAFAGWILALAAGVSLVLG